MRPVPLALAALLALAIGAADSPPATTKAPPSALVSGRYEIRLAGSPIGRMTLSRRRTASGYLFRDRGLMALKLGDKVSRITLEFVCRTDARLRVLSFEHNLQGDGQRHLVRGLVRGRKLVVHYRFSGAEGRREFRLEGPLLISPMATLYFQQQARAGKTKITGSVFEPPTLTLSPYTASFRRIKKGGQTLLAADVTRRLTRIYVEIRPDGQLHLQDGPMGQKVTRLIGKVASPLRAAVDLYRVLSIKVTGRIPPPGIQLRRLRVRLMGIKVRGLALTGGGQELTGNVLTVTAPAYGTGTTYPLPSPAHRKWLRPSTFIQSDHPAVKQRAKAILGPTKDAVRAVTRLYKWVFQTLDKRPIGPAPDAVSVLKHRRGDCNEHSVLFVALARAAGVPARVAVGLVLRGGRFLYHAWAEVWLGRWVPLDPTWDQFPADAGHLRLVYGLGRGVLDLESVVGRLKIEILDWK
ncbi:MAG: transglutaminase-like domain-containing protein [Proteobacteria bacterium]|nr:transglutaminase-like domain-containing protein [Pseudomonadota bacterium]MBU1740942.1 transglutaminase-like domain-containing protein [Pseudomonadota bacterium]